MDPTLFTTEQGLAVPAVTEEEMRAIDRLAVHEFGLGLLQMMENAGRNLALACMEMLGESRGPVLVLAGPGGNGGGGLCAARHLHNHGFTVRILLDRPPERLGEAAQAQLSILYKAGVQESSLGSSKHEITGAALVVDALLGYSLRGAPTGGMRELIAECNEHASRVISLDLPSGMDATTGEAPGERIGAYRTVTLALPKTGLARYAGELFLADIGIPPEVYQALRLEVKGLFDQRYMIPLVGRDRLAG